MLMASPIVGGRGLIAALAIMMLVVLVAGACQVSTAEDTTAEESTAEDRQEDLDAGIAEGDERRGTSGHGHTRNAPAPEGATVEVEFEDFFGTFRARVTLVEALRGQRASRRVHQASRFNPDPDGDMEYMVAEFHFELTSAPRPDVIFELMPVRFTAVSREGMEYSESLVTGLKPSIRASLYEGASHQGWVDFKVTEDEPTLITFGRNFRGQGGIWFIVE